MTVSEQQQFKDSAQSMEVRILTLNVWGIPFVARNKNERIQAIAHQLSTGREKYDFVFLQEVWLLSDYQYIVQKVANRFPHSHYFHSGLVGSGTCIFSCTPILDVHYHQWSLNGFPHKIFHGDWLAGKGVAMAKTFFQGVQMLLVNTHFHSCYNSECDEYLHHRVVQAFETSQLLRFAQSSQSLCILSGDFNCTPDTIPFRLLIHNSGFVDSFQDCPIKPVDDFGGTSDTPQNSYTSPRCLRCNPNGQRIDHILFKGPSEYIVKAVLHDQPFPPRVSEKEFSFSDHEAVRTVLSIKPKSARDTDPIVTSDRDHCFSRTDTLLEASSICAEGLRITGKRRRNFLAFAIVMLLVSFVLLCIINTASPAARIIVAIFMALFALLAFYGLYMTLIFCTMEKKSVLAAQKGLEKLLEEVRIKNARIYEERRKSALADEAR